MIKISRATKADLVQLDILVAQSQGKMDLPEDLFNKRDIALKATLQHSGQIIGFVWCGLMAKNNMGYIDKFIVEASNRRKKVGLGLLKALHKELLKRGVKRIFGVIKQDQYHDSCAIGAVRMAVGGDNAPYTYVSADVALSTAQLKALGDYNG